MYDSYIVRRTSDRKVLSTHRRLKDAVRYVKDVCKETSTYAFIADTKGNVVYEYKQKREEFIPKSAALRKNILSKHNPF